MSRRHRLEIEKSHNLKGEEEYEEDKLKLQKERIYAPVVWRRLINGFKIEDLKEDRYEEVLNIIREYYIKEEVLCRNSELANDPESKKNYLDSVLFNMKDQKSLIIIHEESGVVAGACILCVINKVDFGSVFSRVTFAKGDAHMKTRKLIDDMSRKVDIFVEFDCDSFLKYCAVCVKPEYRKMRLGQQLMFTGVDLARSLHVPVIMGLFTCNKLQIIAKKIGMRVIHEMNYIDIRDEFGELLFDDPGAGNYTVAIMACAVPPPPPPAPPKVSQQEEKKPKLTRGEKRARAVKK